MAGFRDRAAFPVVLWGVAQAMRAAALAFPAFRAKIAERDALVSIETRDAGVGRWYRFSRGRISSGAGPADRADVRLLFKDSETGLRLLTPPMRHFDYINAIKMFKLDIVGEDEATRWFTEVASLMMSAHWSFGEKLSNGETRYVNDTNGGPVFVYVKDAKIVRMTPIEFESEEAAKGRWSISARGKTFTPPPQTSISSHGLSNKSTVYSKDRLLYPMKRVDFDPNGARNPQNRGVSGYERISWDEALDIVASEIRRMKTQHGNGAILSSHSSHHTWGNLGYYLCSLFRFNNAIG
ncbi:MAG: molybdopterin-dependent oxidoreductase, partial [Hyphomicrobiales bacterium]|nr:molybdopterin-dependent oxidoreductase [Hyphomicrobiales bacterium]